MDCMPIFLPPWMMDVIIGVLPSRITLAKPVVPRSNSKAATRLARGE
jgi:hypothetical protein